jgi:signal transduction histidine kinase
VCRADGRWIDIEASISLVRDPDGQPRHFICVMTDITDRRTAERSRDQAAADLADRNDRLEAANQLKLDIIGVLGHGINNPLTTIRGHAEVLAGSWAGLDDERRGRALEAIARQSDRLDTIVRKVISMVMIDSGTVVTDRARLSLRGVVDRALAVAGAKDTPVRGDDVAVLANAEHLRDILINLLTNAAEHGGGVAAVRIESSGDRAVVRVEDDGPGVGPDVRPYLFERLAGASRDFAAEQGTGFGLSVARGLARACHGDLRYEPRPGGGAAFVLELERVQTASADG